MPPRKSKLKSVADYDRSSDPPSDLCSQQSTIISHFPLSKQSSNSEIQDDTLTYPPNKRPKLFHDSSDTSAPPVDRSKSRQIGNMYNFANDSSRHPHNTIDLTVSPNRINAKSLSNGGPRPASFTPSKVPRTLVVKNLKKPAGPDPEHYYNDISTRLDASLQAVFTNSALPYSKETLYKEVMILCQQNNASRLVEMLNGRLADHADQSILAPLLEIVATLSSLEMLASVVKAWDTWMQQLETIRAIFFFLDRSYILRRNLPSIETTAVKVFTDSVTRNPGLKALILQGTCDLISNERSQLPSSQDQNDLITRTVKMLIRQGVYGEALERRLLSETSTFYSQWTERTVASNNLAGYIIMCQKSIQAEKDFARLWALDPTTSKQIEVYLEDILIEGQKERLVKIEDVGELLTKDEQSLIRQLFLLLEKRSLGEGLKPAFEQYITFHGAEIVFDENREDEMVPRLLAFKQQLYTVWEHAFEKHVVLRNALRGAFETFMNKTKRNNMNWGTDNSKPGEMIAKYVDKVLKGGSKAVKTSSSHTASDDKTRDVEREESEEDEDAEITKQLDDVLDLFRFVHGKAVFEAFYKRDLARRLLLGRSASSDAEKSMLTRLKTECGAGFTHNLEQMFKDIETARDEIHSYKAVLHERGIKPAFDLSVNVLSSAAWPSYPDVMVNVPEEVLKATASFEQYFKINHSGRKLEWKHALAHCQLKSTLPKGTKEIVVSSFQAVALLSFNESEVLSYRDLKASTGLDDIELKRTLQSLACANYRVLSKQPKGKEVNVDDVFSVNLAFQHPKYRIKINQIQAKETRQENKQTHERIAIDRKYETQAAIVRIMKGRKSITHAELVSETITATRTRGPLDPADIKTQIETLIEKDYMERDEDEPNTYIYVA